MKMRPDCQARYKLKAVQILSKYRGTGGLLRVF